MVTLLYNSMLAWEYYGTWVNWHGVGDLVLGYGVWVCLGLSGTGVLLRVCCNGEAEARLVRSN